MRKGQQDRKVKALSACPENPPPRSKPLSFFSAIEIAKEELRMNSWKCTICGHIHNDDKEATKFEELPEDWVCPVCAARKALFVKKE
jgi:rubredoxin